jgi:hypothetical protein
MMGRDHRDDFIDPDLDWHDPYDDMSDDEKKELRQFTYDHRMHEIEDAKTSKEFYLKISNLIKSVHDFNEEQVTRLADIIKNEWKPKRGAGSKKDRDEEIWIHWRMMNTEERLMTRLEMINYIMTQYKVTFDAAAKIFNKIK